jgi:hypothetical protein
MDTNNVFVIAAFKRFRFDSSRGLQDVEGLFQIPLRSENGFNLNDIAQRVNRELREQTDESFVDTASNPLKLELENKLEVVKQVIAFKKDLANKANLKAANANQMRVLQDLIDKAKMEKLAQSSIEDLQKQMAELQAAAY